MITAALATLAFAPLPKLTVKGPDLVDPAGKRVLLTGCNLGNWFVIEPWMLCLSDKFKDKEDTASTPAPATTATAPAAAPAPSPQVAAPAPTAAPQTSSRITALTAPEAASTSAPAVSAPSLTAPEASLQPAPAPAPVQLAAAPTAAPAGVQTATSPLGVWLSEKKEGKVRIEDCDGNLCGYSVDAKTGANGAKVLINMMPSGDKWAGRIKDTRSGSIYDSTIALRGSDKLKVQGCAFGGMFCGGETWTRVE